jgi:hypothetical protein
MSLTYVGITSESLVGADRTLDCGGARIRASRSRMAILTCDSPALWGRLGEGVTQETAFGYLLT